MGILDERFTGLQFPCAHIKHAEIEENERLTNEWLKKQGLKEVPKVEPIKPKSPIKLPVFNVPSELQRQPKIIKQTTNKNGYMNLIKRKNDLYSVCIGTYLISEPVQLDEAILIRDKHRANMGLPPAKDKIK